MTHVTCRLTAKNRDQLWNPTLGCRVWATFTFFRGRYFTGRIAQSAKMQPVATDAAWVCLLVTTVSPTKMAELIVMPFGFCTRVGPRKRVSWGPGSPQWKGQFWGLFPHWNALDCVSSKHHSNTGLQTCVQGQCITAKAQLQNGLCHCRGDKCSGAMAFVKILLLLSYYRYWLCLRCAVRSKEACLGLVWLCWPRGIAWQYVVICCTSAQDDQVIK